MRTGEHIRVAMVHGPAAPELDGVSDYVAHLLPALRDVGVDVVPVPVLPVRGSAGRWLAAVRRAARTVRAARPDLVHVQFAPSAYGFSGVPGAALPGLLPSGPPLVTTVHEYGWWSSPDGVPQPVWRLLERSRRWDRETGRLVPRSRAVVATNPGHVAQVRERTGVEPVPVPIAPNVTPVQGTVDAAQVRLELGVPPAATVLAFFGFVHSVKGLRYVIEALPRLRRDHGDVHLLVVGGFTSAALPEPEADAFRRELLDLARRHGVADAVTFTGHVPAEAASHALAAADVAVLPFTQGVSTKSGALLTMLAHALPTAVTVTDPPDPRLRDGETVAVVPARRSAKAVAASLDRLLSDGSLRSRIAQGGRKLAAEHTWPRIAEAHRELYERARRCDSG